MSENAARPEYRGTLHLSAEKHDALTTWQHEAARKLGRIRVTRQEVLAALVDRLLADQKLADEILASL